MKGVIIAGILVLVITGLWYNSVVNDQKIILQQSRERLALIDQDIESGKYDTELAEMKTQTDPEKRKRLDSFFDGIKSKQDELLKKEAQEKEAKVLEQIV